MEVFERAEGFKGNLKFTLSEFNISGGTAIGVDQAAAWVEALSTAVDSGIDEIFNWGIAYEWLSNKFYDTKFAPGESDSGTISTYATPMGQAYDIAQSHLVGKATMTNSEALEHISVTGGMNVTGFDESDQRVVFLHNQSVDQPATVNLGAIPDSLHTSIRILAPANSPISTWSDESLRELRSPESIADSRGDMKVISGDTVGDSYTLNPGEMLVVITSDPDRDLVIEGAHNVTDPRTGMVDDLIVGADGNDILRGHVGNDTLDGGGGRNVLSGGKGDDYLKAGNEGDVIFADGGSDTVEGGVGNDLIVSGSGKERRWHEPLVGRRRPRPVPDWCRDRRYDH